MFPTDPQSLLCRHHQSLHFQAAGARWEARQARSADLQARSDCLPLEGQCCDEVSLRVRDVFHALLSCSLFLSFLQTLHAHSACIAR